MRQNIQKLYQARIHTFTPECLELQDGKFDFHLRHAVEGCLPSADQHYAVGIFATSEEGHAAALAYGDRYISEHKFGM
ncbi:hypothetical protein PQR70_17510 [Paraburkholderia madseniana]|jgi:hypothetical protein|uniref:Uncharacterized protein n=1 Tax=Paraburkholderia madseniana TaxID=2599607 RepID=A0A6N6W4S4_9BURK|nr:MULTISPECIES: hypothetical protein [Paraburkholderia]KAE8755453.1 hypothetical protein FSO04_34145 [Paraburkholderia madseniana]MCX4148780.1 hypothetical protein [Paraburkholderia madseniana]MDN7151718.1 hypothetical protein [Paraburkholderia sp. WS6]MDQ6410598.1 hypothetical protein [Paraburkholderia madseniana]NPT69570.1 hypothetical protein [Paraburkholderia madseniana]